MVFFVSLNLPPSQQQCDGRDGLPQAHVIRQDPAAWQLGRLPEGLGGTGRAGHGKKRWENPPINGGVHGQIIGKYGENHYKL